MPWPDPAQRQRIVEIRDNLIVQIGKRTNAMGTVNLGMPTLAKDS
jgi:hypothetical protein